MADSIAFGGRFYKRRKEFVSRPRPAIPVAAPALVSLNYSLGDTAGGGQSIVITGTNMSGITDVSFGGTSATITDVTSTTCTVTLPAKSAGATTVIATNDGGTSNGLSFEFWTPTQITGVQAYLDSNKNVTQSSGNVSTWRNQVNSANFSSSGGLIPTQVSNVFGTLPSIRFVPGGVCTQMIGTGMSNISTFSYFAVVKWTSSDTTAVQSTYNTPLSLTGGSGWSSFGASGGSIAYKKYDASIITRNSGLNDGMPHLIGVTGDASVNIKLFCGNTQSGATATPGGTAATYYDKIGAGYTTTDGWDGDIGAFIACTAVISAGDLTKLNTWAKQRFGTVD